MDGLLIVKDDAKQFEATYQLRWLNLFIIILYERQNNWTVGQCKTEKTSQLTTGNVMVQIFNVCSVLPVKWPEETTPQPKGKKILYILDFSKYVAVAHSQKVLELQAYN